MAISDNECRLFKLSEKDELRFSIEDPSAAVTIELVDGTAEIFGAEMLMNKIYSFSSFTSVAVTTSNNCLLKVRGKNHKMNITKQKSTLRTYHELLEECRVEAKKNNVRGPVTLLAGPTDVGKSTLCRYLLNSAARSGWQPLFIDLDVGQSSISIPGTVGIVPVENTVDIVGGFDERKLSVYFFGYKSPGHNILLYSLLIKKLSQTLHSRMKHISKNVQASGVVVDTCGWTTGNGYCSTVLASKAFEIDVLFVLGDSDLYTQLQQDVSSNVKVIFIPKLSGVVERNRSVRIKRRNDLIREYFYGSTTPLEPYIFEVSFSDIEVFQVFISSKNRPTNLSNVTSKDISVESVLINTELLNHILALSYVDSIDEDVMLTSVLGFICIKDIDMERKIITVLSPQPSPLPKRILIKGDILLDDDS
ncbi:protein CLP1 homolog [Stegodyphus dumicola]|uniref:protein CLP1 homolog n=1 Tax=Stegodyphus dumicola TaxID=202533 RepID=UPI0015B2CDBA|nr:protein CLP1 homolog [Stegodyphus dumicola]